MDIDDVDFEELWEFCQTAKRQYAGLYYFDGNEIHEMVTRHNYSSKINEYFKGRNVSAMFKHKVAYVLIQMGLIK